MILIDYNGIAVASMYAQQGISDGKQDPNDPKFLRHLILNSLRMYNKKYRDQYGEMVICLEGRSWRKDVYSFYKASRGKDRDASGLDWKQIFETFSSVADEISKNIPWLVIRHENAEADDIIATLVQKYREPHMIISNDKDFAQLQLLKDVKQFSPLKGKLIEEKKPELYLKEHILRGDSGDGIPNFLSNDNVLYEEGLRQKPLSKKKISECLENWTYLDEYLNQEQYRNFQRNKTLIDLLSNIPLNIMDEISENYRIIERTPNKKVLKYLISIGANNLIGLADDFFPSTNFKQKVKLQ